MRPYEKTHKWITFTADLQKANYRFWMMLGEAESKCHHLRGVPLLPEMSKKLHMLYLAKGALATTAIEGNTLTEEEVVKRLQGKLELSPSRQYLGQEVDNIVEACNGITESLFEAGNSPLSRSDLEGYNKLILNNVPLKKEVIPGKIRNYNVGAGRYLGAPYEDCGYLLDKLCDWLNAETGIPGRPLANGVLKAILAHLYIAWIHPFGDGNGRTARLVEYRILFASGVPHVAAHVLSNHYNQTRNEYYIHLDNASKSGGDIFPFLEYALQGFTDGLKEQIALIQEMQLRILWERHIHNIFKDHKRETERRRRELAFDISTRYFEDQEAVDPNAIKILSPRLVRSYYGKSERTITRDVNELIQLGLVVRGRDAHLRPNIAQMSVFKSATMTSEY